MLSAAKHLARWTEMLSEAKHDNGWVVTLSKAKGLAHEAHRCFALLSMTNVSVGSNDYEAQDHSRQL